MSSTTQAGAGEAPLAGCARAQRSFTPYAKRQTDGSFALSLLVEGVHCGGCVARIERALKAMPAVAEARVNLTTRRLSVSWTGARRLAEEIGAEVERLGFKAVAFEPTLPAAEAAAEERFLLRAMAVAGFAAANVMLLSISVWAGAGEETGPATRELFHWISALVALPAILYAGRPFFRSALRALAALRTNMDVPISLAVLLAGGMSLAETASGGPHAYFDSAVTLLFFLLVGRYLDRRARGRARSAGERLLALASGEVTLLSPDGRQEPLPVAEVRPGMCLLVAAGDRIAVDGRLLAGRSEVDQSLITGETLPLRVSPGDRVFAGMLNIGAPLKMTVEAVGERRLLSEIVRLMELAEQRRSRYVTLADRLARVYAPFVHTMALAAFLGWWLLGGLAWQPSLLIAVAVLIITCPCALGLAVPVVQVIASGRLLRRGILLKSATALERLARVDRIVFDKTGTLTLGRLELKPGVPREEIVAAARLAAASRHPLARALSRAAPEVAADDEVREFPGEGLLLETAEGQWRLGSRAWCGLPESEAGTLGEASPELWFAAPGRPPRRFAFEDTLREDAAEVVAHLRRNGLAVELLSGDRPEAVAEIAGALGIEEWRARQRPADKVARLESLAASGSRVLMVGDGLNDAPALAAAAVSLSPATAADISQTTADAVFQGERLAPVVELLEVARRAEGLVRQNFALALAYNLAAVPIAVVGLVTPLVAAVAMSSSSLLVIGNALRLTGRRAVR